MPLFKILFLPDKKQVFISEKENLLRAVGAAKIPLKASCAGAGVCRTCQLKVKEGTVRIKPGEHQPASIKPPGKDGEKNSEKSGLNNTTTFYVLACQAFPLSDLTVEIPEAARLTKLQIVTDNRDDYPTIDSAENFKACPLSVPPSPYYYPVYLVLPSFSLPAAEDKLSHLLKALKQKTGLVPTRVSLKAIQSLAKFLRPNDQDKEITVFLTEDIGYPSLSCEEIISGHLKEKYYGLAVDLGTTTVVAELLELTKGVSLAAKGTYNQQLSYGEDVISRLVYAQENENSLPNLQEAIVDTVNTLINELTISNQISSLEIKAVVCAGNPAMTHLFLGLDPVNLRLKPYTVAAHNIPAAWAQEAGLKIYPQAPIKCVPGVANYLGGDIIAGVVATNMTEREGLTLFIDVGTNGEMVLGNKEWLVACSCSAGPAFEGSGLKHGILAIPGAIDSFEITSNIEVKYTTIDHFPPKGICGSGLISCLAGLFRSGVIDRRGKFNLGPDHPRLYTVNGEKEFVLVRAGDTGINKDITISENEINNLIRAKAAVFAGIRSMLQFLNLSLEAIDRLILAGGFGRYLNLKEAVTIGMLPDLPPQKCSYVGNSALKGAKMMLLSAEARKKTLEIARKMMYLDLSEGNTFTEEFLAAIFIPHTNQNLFPSVINSD
ncbi:MAG: ASKHA domain-containing protein [Peptococcaceae bacterium]